MLSLLIASLASAARACAQPGILPCRSVAARSGSGRSRAPPARSPVDLLQLLPQRLDPLAAPHALLPAARMRRPRLGASPVRVAEPRAGLARSVLLVASAASSISIRVPRRVNSSSSAGIESITVRAWRTPLPPVDGLVRQVTSGYSGGSRHRGNQCCVMDLDAMENLEAFP